MKFFLIALSFLTFAFEASANTNAHPEQHQQHEAEGQQSLRGADKENGNGEDESLRRDLKSSARCGCDACTDAVWTTYAGAYQCGARIDYKASKWGGNLSHEDACRFVSNEFPSTCGPSCHPDLCAPAPAPVRCGCASCTDSTWDHAAGGSHSCGARIDWLQTSDGGSYSYLNACRYVSNEYPNDECGPMCHPDLCDAAADPTSGPSPLPTEDPTPNPTPEPTKKPTAFPTAKPTEHPTPNPTPEPTKKPTAFPTTRPTGIPTVAPSASPTTRPTETPTDGPTSGPTVKPTPSPVAPMTPSPTELPEPDYCGCHACTEAVWTTYAGAHQCGSRINWLQTADGGSYSRLDACRRVSNEYPYICGPACHPDQCDVTDKPTSAPVIPPPRCGCEHCSDEVWNHPAGGSHACGARIDWLQTVDGGSFSPLNACRYVSNQFPNGECGPMCHPDLCDTHTCALYEEPYNAPDDVPPNPPLQITDDLFCFPLYSARERYTDTFAGGFIIEAKDGRGALCGPGNNVFTSDTVSYDAAAQELTMEYKKIDGVWAASEVRVLLPESQGLTFGYGTFDFSVKSVSVYDENGDIVSSALPPDLVLGLFTWDTTDDYSLHANWNHEVDVEISQWGDPSNLHDVQFLTQPHHPGGPHFPARLSSGGPGATTPADFDQGGHSYGFLWKPDEILWSTTAGGGQNRAYSAQIAKDACAPDHIQCLPANVEVRINLWNMGGADDSRAPDVPGVADGTRVEVVIDDFTFVPSTFDHVPDGGACSKHCQCAVGSMCGESGTCVVLFE